MRGFLDGSSNGDGRSGCGVVIKGADRNKWITISNNAAPLGICTAMTAEVVVVCVLTGILDLVLNESLSTKKINQRTDAIFWNHST